MRTFVGLALVLLVCLPRVSADEVVLADGKVLSGVVEHVQMKAHGTLARAALRSVHLNADRTAIDAAWIERLLRFGLDRARRRVAADGHVGVYVGRGVSAPSALAVVRRLDEAKRAPRLLFEADMTTAGLAGLRAVIVPGGWAPSQLVSLGMAGQAALADFIKRGGGYLGICAGGYLVCRDVVWAGETYPYPIAIAPGTATGPVPGLAPWPRAEVVELRLATGRTARALYAGGAYYDIERAQVVARYANGRTAAVQLGHGKGRLVLTGAHVEFRDRIDADLLGIGRWAERLKPGSAALFDDFVKRALGR